MERSPVILAWEKGSMDLRFIVWECNFLMKRSAWWGKGSEYENGVQGKKYKMEIGISN